MTISSRIIVWGIFFLFPFTLFAAQGTSTADLPKDDKKDELKKQLVDTVNVYSSIISRLQKLSQRVSERENILIAQNNLSNESKAKLDIKMKALDDKLVALNENVEDDLTKLAQVVVDSNKPVKSLKSFKKEALEIKTEILSAHKLLIDIIDIIKKESLNDNGREE